MHGVKIHNGRSWWRLSHVWRKFADKFTWLRFQKTAFPPRHKNGFSRRAQSWLWGRATVDSGDKMNFPSYFAAFLGVSSSPPSPCALQYITFTFLFGMWDGGRVSSGSNMENWLTHCEVDWEPDRNRLLCLFVSQTSGLNCFLPHHTGKMTLGAGLFSHIRSSQTPPRNAAQNKRWCFSALLHEADISLFFPASFMV